MEKKAWKTIAIIFMIIAVVETAYLIWAVTLYTVEENRANECYYNVCSDYVDAWYENKVCYCYDYDLMGDLQIAKTKLMK